MALHSAGGGTLDSETAALVRVAAAIAGANEQTTRTVMAEAVGCVPGPYVEEVILQSYLFAGFPRALNAARAWRTISGTQAPLTDSDASIDNGPRWEAEGEATCAVVYGESYDMLRENIRNLHPALDAWMITDGYGKVLSRPALDLRRRELCIVAACAASGQQRQLHSHLHGALNAGSTPDEVAGVLYVIGDLVGDADAQRYDALLSRVSASRGIAAIATHTVAGDSADAVREA
ncbi:MAG: carboxymuconolactone decarboxylase family protein [Gemmatimonadaceae bacterium]|nr:carboxymuconolactone decarboxylase family protein [Gemmatimonadaceae bacterium]MDQ3242267.1 carboxymuconolactone decarboxylase family protein [Gemmatimonadota bacterium]